MKAERVGDVLQLQRRQVVVEVDHEYEEIGVRSFGKGIFHKEPVTGSDLGSKRVFRIEPGDLVLSNVFAWEGAVAVASERDAGRIGSHRFMTFTPTDDRISTSWAAWFFQSEPGLELIRKASPGSAGRNRTLAIDRFEALEIPLPPVEEQKQVADRLDRLRTTTIQIAQRSTHAGKLSAALAVSTASRLDLEDASKAEAGWRKTRLDEVLALSTSQVIVEPTARYSIAGVYSFGRGLIDRGVIAGAETSYKTLTSLDQGNVVMSKLNGWEGAVAVVEPRFEGFCVSPEYPTFRPDPDQLLPRFFSGIARSPWFWGTLDTNARGSMVRRRRINSAEFLSTSIWLPPMATQRRIAERLNALESAAHAYDRRADRIEALVPAALNEVFAGLR